MATQAKVIIKAEDNLTKAVNSAKNSLTSLESAALNIGKVFKNALGFTAIAASIKKLGDAVYGCFSDFEEADRKYKQLEIALGGGEAFSKAKDTIAELSRVTLESKDKIETMVSELAALGKSSDEIDKISKAAVYLSNVTGKDLNSSMTTLLNTYSGTTTQLKRLGIDVEDLTDKELKNGAAVDRVITSLKVYSDELSRTDTRQNLTNISNTWGDIKQSVGDLVNFSFSPMIKSFDDALLSIQKSFDSWIQDVKLVFSNFPEVFEKLSLTINSMFQKFISYDNVKTIALAIADFIPKAFESALKRAASVLDLFLNIIPDAIKSLLDGLFNYAMYIVTNVCNDIGFNLTELINSIGSFLTESPIGKIIDSLVSGIVNGVKLAGTIISNIPELIRLVVENAGSILKNGVINLKNWFYTSLSDSFNKLGSTLESLNLPQRLENLKVSIQNFLGRINAWFFATGETAKDTFRYIADVIKVTFSWDTIKTTIEVLFKNIGTVALAVIKEVFINIPSMLESLFEGVVKWISYLGLKLKNTLVEAVQNFINDAGNSLKGTWLDKLFNIGTNLSKVSFNIDRAGEDALREKAINSFKGVGENFEKAIDDAVKTAGVIKENTKEITNLYSAVDGIKVSKPEYEEIKPETKGSGSFVNALFSISESLAEKLEDNSDEWRDLTEKISSLLSPSIEKWEKETGETFGQKLLTWSQKSGDEYLDASKKSFANIGKTLKEWGISFSDETASELESLVSGISTYLSDIFGDDIEAFSTWLQGVLDKNKTSVVSAVDKVGESVKNSEKKSSGTKSILSSAFTSATSSSVKDESGNALSIFSKESALSNITASLSSSFSALFSALGSVIDAVSSGAWWMAALSVALEGFVSVMVPAINAVLAPLKDALTWIGQSLALLIVPLLDALTPALSFLQRVIVEAVTPALQILSPIITLVSTLLDAMSPIIALVGKAFTILMAPVQFVADLFSWLGSWLKFLGECVGVCAWNLTHWFNQRSFPSSPGGFSSNAFSGLSERLAAWDNLSSSKGSVEQAANNAVSSSTALSSAAYQGGTHITINIYQQAPVVGDGGMRAFAQMIRNEFDELEYYGVTG